MEGFVGGEGCFWYVFLSSSLLLCGLVCLRALRALCSRILTGLATTLISPGLTTYFLFKAFRDNSVGKSTHTVAHLIRYHLLIIPMQSHYEMPA